MLFQHKVKQIAKQPEEWWVEVEDLFQKWPQLLT